MLNPCLARRELAYNLQGLEPPRGCGMGVLHLVSLLRALRGGGTRHIAWGVPSPVCFLWKWSLVALHEHSWSRG